MGLMGERHIVSGSVDDDHMEYVQFEELLLLACKSVSRQEDSMTISPFSTGDVKISVQNANRLVFGPLILSMCGVPIPSCV